MFNNRRVVAVVPAGRRRYLEILIPYLSANRHILDVCHFWSNTTNSEDAAFLHLRASEDPFFQVVSSILPVNGVFSIYHFFRECIDPDTLYLRFDDDICWIAPDAVEALCAFRLDNPDYFLVFANTINNSVCSHIHQRIGCIGLDEGVCTYDVFGAVSHRRPQLARLAHESFLIRLEKGRLNEYLFPRWVACQYERISINCICWLGADFAEFSGEVGIEEEEWLTQERPMAIGRPTAICGGALVSHFAYHTQREWLEANTDLLARYRELALSNEERIARRNRKRIEGREKKGR